jgi:N-acetylglutamate synthase-like GNAT family acetyltransferase
MIEREHASDPRQSPMKRPEQSEKRFYLNSFRHRGILFHVEDARSLRAAQGLLDELVGNPTNIVICAARGLPRGAPTLTTPDLKTGRDSLASVALQLLETGRADLRRPAGLRGVRGLAFSVALAERLGIRKLVVVDNRGGLAEHDGRRGFVSTRDLARLCRGRDTVGGWSVAELDCLSGALSGSLTAVNLAAVGDIEEELFSYEGAGTLITGQDYCRVAALGLDDFHEAERLLARGEREGFLLPRDPEARAHLLLCGYGAWFEGGNLAGLVGLETNAYRRSRVGEVVGLYTITRFQGEGVGVRLLEHLREVGVAAGLKALFACTRNQRAAGFFDRNGFSRVDADQLPAAKFAGRESGDLPQAFWLRLDR